MENQQPNQQFNQQPNMGPAPITTGKRIWYMWGALIIKIAISYAVTLAAEVVYMALYAYNNPDAFLEMSTSQDAIMEFAYQIVEVLMPYTTLLEGIAALVTIPILLFMCRSDRKKEKQFGIVRPPKAPIGKYSAIILLSAAMCIGVNCLLYISGLTVIDETYTEVTTAMYSADFGVQILCLGFLVPICEELVFRGLMYKRLRYSSSFLQAGLYTAIAFGIFHGNVVQMIYAFVLGMLFAYLYEKYGSVKAPILAHVMMNLVSVFATEYGLMGWMSVEYIRIATITVVCAAIASTMFVLIQRMEN